MEYDLWTALIALSITVTGGLIVLKHGIIYDYLKKLIKKSINIPKASHGILSNVKAPYELPIGSFTNITATFHGTLKRGFFSCQILDCFGKYNWCEDKSTTKLLGQNRQTGILNFRNKKHSTTWAIRPESYLTKGEGKLIIGVFVEKDIVENGQITEYHPHVALEEKEILLV